MERCSAHYIAHRQPPTNQSIVRSFESTVELRSIRLEKRIVTRLSAALRGVRRFLRFSGLRLFGGVCVGRDRSRCLRLRLSFPRTPRRLDHVCGFGHLENPFRLRLRWPHQIYPGGRPPFIVVLVFVWMFSFIFVIFENVPPFSFFVFALTILSGNLSIGSMLF